MKTLDQSLIATSAEGYIHLKMMEAPALQVLLRGIELENRVVRDYCLRVLAYGIAELPWLPTMTALEAEVLIREERGRAVFTSNVSEKLWSCQNLAQVRDICMLVRRGRNSDPEASDAALYYLACLSWLWMLDHDLFMRSTPELQFEEVVIEVAAA